jgi:hypothetical protein
MAGYIGKSQGVTQVDGYNRSEADAEFVQVTGDTMTGALAVNGNLTVDTNTLFVDAANNRVGVGTSSPTDLLHVKKGANDPLSAQLLLQNDNAGSGAAGIAFQVTDNTESTAYAPKGAILYERTATNGRGVFKFMNDNVNDTNPFSATDEVMRITNDGNVGIGTSSPTDGKLVITGSGVTTAQGIRLTGDTADARFICESATLGAGILGTFSNHSQLFYTNSTERMRIDSIGRVTMPSQARAAFTLNGGWRTLSANTSYGVTDGGFPINIGGFFNGGTIGGFTVVHVPVTGWYRIDMYTYSGNGTVAGARLALFRNDAQEIMFTHVGVTADQNAMMSKFVELNAGDYINYRAVGINFTAYFAGNHSEIFISLEG